MKLKKKRNSKWIIIPILVLTIFGVIKLCSSKQSINNNAPFIKRLLQDSNYHLLYEKQEKNLFKKFISFWSGGEPLLIKNKI